MSKEPVHYTPEIALVICDRLALGESLRQICRSPGMPTETAVRLWSLTPDHPFSSQYADARNLGMDAVAEETLQIADDGSNDWLMREVKEGRIEPVLHAEHYQRSRLRVDTRKWYLSKIAPKRYGDKTTTEHVGPGGGPIAYYAVDTGIKRGD